MHHLMALENSQTVSAVPGNSQRYIEPAAHTVLHHLPMGLILNAKTPQTVRELAVACWYPSGCEGII